MESSPTLAASGSSSLAALLQCLHGEVAEEHCSSSANGNSLQNTPATPQSESRHKCAACFKQFKQKEFLVDHMERAGHSMHEPRCGNCFKHCRCLDALREHLLGSLAKKECAYEFAQRGCSLCLVFLESADAMNAHRATCELSMSPQHLPVVTSHARSKRIKAPNTESTPQQSDGLVSGGAVALDCEMVGGGENGCFDLCARVCLVDEQENIMLNILVRPQLPVTDYRFEFTGLGPEYLASAIPIQEARKAVEDILYQGERAWASRRNARLLVGHSLHHDLGCLGINYPLHLQRDTAFYPPLLRTSNVCNKLQYLTQTYLGYRIQDGKSHDPYEDAVAAMRLYKRMSRVDHPRTEGFRGRGFPGSKLRKKEAEALSPEALLEISIPRFECWCLDK